MKSFIVLVTLGFSMTVYASDRNDAISQVKNAGYDLVAIWCT